MCELKVNDYLLSFTFSQADLELNFRLSLLAVHFKNINVAHSDLNIGRDTSYWLSWMDAQLYS